MGRDMTIKVDWSQRQTLAERRDDIGKARKYLAETDWYVTRQNETGKPMPEDVRAAREAARQTASQEPR